MINLKRDELITHLYLVYAAEPPFLEFDVQETNHRGRRGHSLIVSGEAPDGERWECTQFLSAGLPVLDLRMAVRSFAWDTQGEWINFYEAHQAPAPESEA